MPAIKESGHNAIILDLSLKSQNPDKIIPKEFKKFKWAITHKSLRNFKKQTQNVTFNVDKQENINQIYFTWEKELNNVMEKCFKKRFKATKNNNNYIDKEHKDLKMKKLKLKKKLTTYINDGDIMNRDVTKIRIETINKKIIEKTNI